MSLRQIVRQVIVKVTPDPFTTTSRVIQTSSLWDQRQYIPPSGKTQRNYTDDVFTTTSRKIPNQSLWDYRLRPPVKPPEIRITQDAPHFITGTPPPVFKHSDIFIRPLDVKKGVPYTAPDNPFIALPILWFDGSPISITDGVKIPVVTNDNPFISVTPIRLFLDTPSTPAVSRKPRIPIQTDVFIMKTGWARRVSIAHSGSGAVS